MNPTDSIKFSYLAERTAHYILDEDLKHSEEMKYIKEVFENEVSPLSDLVTLRKFHFEVFDFIYAILEQETENEKNLPKHMHSVLKTVREHNTKPRR